MEEKSNNFLSPSRRLPSIVKDIPRPPLNMLAARCFMGFCSRKPSSLEYMITIHPCVCVCGSCERFIFPFFSAFPLRTSNNAKDEIFAFKFVGFFDILTFLLTPLTLCSKAVRAEIPFFCLFSRPLPRLLKPFLLYSALGLPSAAHTPRHLLP